MRVKLFVFIFLLSIGVPLSAQKGVPDFAEGAVWYHLVIERFRNGNPGNDPSKKHVVGEEVADWQVHPWASDWHKRQVWESPRQVDFQELVNDRRYGGDLLGVLERLPYLKNLGVDVICLSPVFEAPSALKYDFASFHHVDNNFGNDPEKDLKKIRTEGEDASKWEWTSADRRLADLIWQTHKLNMKVVLEVAFNYCGREFWAFKDVVKNQQESKYKDWFVIYDWDDPMTPDTVEFDYATWQNNDELPLFRQDENGLVEPVRNYIFNSTQRWMELKTEQNERAGIDGWYVRNVSDIPYSFWNDWLDLVQKINPAAVVVSEVAPPSADGVAWPDFTAAVNYPLMSLMHEFFVTHTTDLTITDFDRRLAALRRGVALEKRNTMLTPIGDVETGRIASLIRNARTAPDQYIAVESSNGHDGAAQPHGYDPSPPNEDDRRVQKLLTLFQFTYPGAPMIYYGDESGMWGSGPDRIKPMLWPEIVYEDEFYVAQQPPEGERARNRFNNNLFRFYQNLSQLRHKHKALRFGVVRTFLIDDVKRLYAFSRQYKEEEVLVILNTDARDHDFTITSPWPSSSKVKDVLNDKTYRVKDSKLKVSLEKKSGLILVKD